MVSISRLVIQRCTTLRGDISQQGRRLRKGGVTTIEPGTITIAT